MIVESTIIETIFSEDTYHKVSFLKPIDFSNKLYKELWKVLEEFEGDIMRAITILEVSKKKDIVEMIHTECGMSGVNGLVKRALLVKEMSYKRLLLRLLSDLSFKSKNALESTLINECLLAVNESDIFILSEGILDYIGSHASNLTDQRINGYLNYIKEDIEQIKRVTDGNR